MNNLLWNEFSDISEENSEEAEIILQAFEDVIDGLLLLDDYNYIFNNINCNEYTKQCYVNLKNQKGSFAELSERFEAIRNIIFGDALDWEEIKRSLR